MPCEKALKRLAEKEQKERCLHYRICTVCGEDLQVLDFHPDGGTDLKCGHCDTVYTD